MSAETTIIRYTGATPGADALVYPFFDTVTAFPGARYVGMHRMKRLVVDIANNAAGTFNLYKSSTRVTNPALATTRDTTKVTWVQIATFAVPAVTTTSNILDLLVEEYDDFRLEFVNGGTAQSATWFPNIALTGERVKSN